MSTLHRLADADLPAILALLAGSGGTARTAETWAADRMTALALGEPGSPAAVMPVARRRIRAMPGRELDAGWISSNTFASRMGLRRQTRGTAPGWPALLPELDVLLVTRRDESSLGARWYAQTGFHDVLSIRCLYLDMDAPPTARTTANARFHVQVITPGQPEWSGDGDRWQAQMASVYNDVYGGYGGPRLRTASSPPFWSHALAYHYYREHYQFQVLGLWETPGGKGALLGYAVVGWSGWHSKRPRMDVLELATRQWDTSIATDLLQTTSQLAWSKNVRQVRAVVSAHDPYRGHLARTGFEDRWGYVTLAKWLHPQRYLDRIAPKLPAELGDLRLELRAPGEVPLTLVRGTPAANGRTLAVEGSPRTLTRLLLNRLDVAAAVQEGAIAGVVGTFTDADQSRLSAAFPWTPWAFHMLDYI
jgi:hypothetical protein